jgi:anti-sigma B factor antagonist
MFPRKLRRPGPDTQPVVAILRYRGVVGPPPAALNRAPLASIVHGNFDRCAETGRRQRVSETRYNLRGEIDVAVAPTVRADLKRLVQTGNDLLIDCTALTFIDSTGIAVLLEANHALEAAGRRILVANVPSSCRRTFELLGLGNLLRYDREAS